MDNLIDAEEAAKTLNLKIAVFRQLRRAAGLPAPALKKANACFYDKYELVQFAKNNDVAKIISETRQKIRSGGKSIRAYNRTGLHANKAKVKQKPLVEPVKRVVTDTMINRFIRGDFLPSDQQAKRQQKLKKAKLNSPKRVIVHLDEIYGLN